LVNRVLREQCTEVANLFNNNLEPSVEQIQDLSEIAKAWVTAWLVGGVGAPSAPDPEPFSGFSMTFNMDEGLNETARKAEPEVEEDPFRYHVTAVEIKAGSPIPFVPLAGLDSPEIPDSSNSSENSNSSKDSEAGVTNPTNLIDNPVEKNSQPTNSSVVTVEDVKAAIAEHGPESFAEFCKIPLWSAKGNLGKVIDRGVAGPKTVAWIKSLRVKPEADTKKPEKLTEPEEPKTQCIPWARARVVCRNRTADGKAEERLLARWINSGATDIDWFLKDSFGIGPTGVWV
jgi:hypothetical protein